MLGINLLLNSINRGLSISHYRKQGVFYSANSHTATSPLLSSDVTTTKRQLVKKIQRLEKPIQLIFCHVTRNLANFVFNQLIFQFWIVLHPFWAWHEIFTFVLNRFLDLFRFNSDWIWNCPKSGLLVQFMNYQSKWLIQWEFSKKISLLKLEVR